jgi:DNA polymerase III epsilon subunit-like protein
MTNTSTQAHTYISVDVETAGPNPGSFSLLSIGACTIYPPQETFYVELKPVNERSLPEALAITGLSMDKLAQEGMPPNEAMLRFAAWLEKVTPQGSMPLFVALNAPFDWSFINDYFIRTIGRNPFGHSALDMKALYMGLTGAEWEDTYIEAITSHIGIHIELTHHALQDALDQAVIFRHLLAEWKEHAASWQPRKTGVSKNNE